MRRVTLVAVFLVALVAPAWADFQAGVDAYKRGDYATALKEWRPLGEQGDADAQNNLGLMYRKGQGVPQNYAEAAKWFRLGAEQGDAAAQNNLGLMYDTGDGVPQDYAEAEKWWRLAAEQGSAEAQFNLGVMYNEGDGVPQDYAEAVKWYRRAAEQGDVDADTDESGVGAEVNYQLVLGRNALQPFLSVNRLHEFIDETNGGPGAYDFAGGLRWATGDPGLSGSIEGNAIVGRGDYEQYGGRGIVIYSFALPDSAGVLRSSLSPSLDPETVGLDGGITYIVDSGALSLGLDLEATRATDAGNTVSSATSNYKTMLRLDVRF